MLEKSLLHAAQTFWKQKTRHYWSRDIIEEKSSHITWKWKSLISRKTRSNIIEIQHSKKQSLEVFKGSNSKKTPIRKGPLSYQNRPQGGGRYYYKQNQASETKTKIFDFKLMQVQVSESSIMQVKHQMTNTSFTIQKELPVIGNSELVPLIKIATLEHVHQFMNFFTKSIPNVLLARRQIYVNSNLRKKFSESSNFICCKGVRNPICKSPIWGENTKIDKMSKEQFRLVEQEILEMFEKGAIQEIVPT